MNFVNFLRFSLLFAASTSVIAVENAPATDSSRAAQKSRVAKYQVDFRVAIKAPAGTKKLRVWLPLPNSSDSQQVSQRQITTLPKAISPQIQTEPSFGNTFAYLEFDSPDGAQLITHKFQAELIQLDWNVDYAKVTLPQQWPASFEPFQRRDPRSEEGQQLQQVLAEIETKTNGGSESEKLIEAIDWVDRNLSYDHSIASLSADPMHALVHRRGHCSDYHGLCSTLAHSVGYPSRVLYGLHMFSKGSPSHCKLEVFLPPYGWVSYDLSETQKLNLKTAADESMEESRRNELVTAIKNRTLRGFRENTWLQVTQGVGYPLVPAADNPITIVRTIYAEADGKPVDESNWVTIHTVDEMGGEPKRFQSVDSL